jgi:predicted nucleotidyltransferase
MFQQLLEKIALGLEERSIPYMIIGGQAVLLYGEPRLTKDIDLTLGAGPERLTEVLELIAEQEWRVLPESPIGFVDQTMVLPCLDEETGIRIDFIFSNSEYEHQAIRKALRIPIGKAQVCFAAPEDLIVHKIIAGRPRDLEDARIVLAKQKEVDLEYVRHWLKQFEESLGEPFLQSLEEIQRTR